VRIPNGPSGFPTLSPTQLRAYGTAGFTLADHEEPRGCPRLYHAKYVLGRLPAEDDSHPLRHGSYVHRVLYLMEAEQMDPDEALLRAFPAATTPEAFAEARRDIDAYLARPATPRDRFAMIGAELDLGAELYVDEEYGPVWVRAILDWIGLDPDLPNVLHVNDYKTNRQPPSTDDVRGDVQLKIQHFVALEFARQLGIEDPRVVVHLDAIKWREVEVAFTDADIADFRDWAEVVARTILRDEDAAPVLNPNCDLCPIKGDCPAYATLPAGGKKLLTGLNRIKTDAGRLRWRDAANRFRLLLEKAVKAIDDDLKAQALRQGRIEIGDTEWVAETDYADRVDLPSLHRELGPAFYDVVSTSRNKVAARTEEWDAHARAAALGCFSKVAVGTAVSKRKIKKERKRER
jgi:hypothetical protein